MLEQLTRISRNAEIMGGKACIKGTRVTVGVVLTLLSEGKLVDELLSDYPHLEYEDILQAIAYAAWAVEAKEEAIQTA